MSVSQTDSHIYLDALCEDDATILHLWRRDPIVRDGALAYPFLSSLDAEIEWIRGFTARGTPNEICLAIRRAESGDLLGYCQLRSIDWVSKTAEFGIVIGHPEARGRGIGKEALALTVRYAVKQLGLRRLWLRVPVFNDAAISLYKRAGFELEGRMTRHAFRNGEFHDVLIYGWEVSSSSTKSEERRAIRS